jgi:membrane protein DedA with SNARE-associated domain/membrane-associated phospholipid phosphatase
MEHVQPYLEYLKANPDWAIAIVFLIAFGEALLIIGLFVPSTVVLVGAGTLVGTGNLGFWPVFIATCVGAIAGDQVSYWAGRFYGERLKSLWPLSRYPQLLEKGEAYVRLHGGKSIAVGRFIPGVKAVVPGIVGMFRMNQIFFLVVNIASGIVWSLVHILPGILLGQGLSFASELSGRLVIILLMLLGILAVCGWFIRLIAVSLSPYFNQMLVRISRWLRSFGNRNLQRLGRTLSPDHPRSYLTLVFLLVVVLGILLMLDIVLGLVVSNAVSNLDVSVLNLLSELRNAPSDELMVGVTMLGDFEVIGSVGLAVVFWLFLRRDWKVGTATGLFLLAAKLLVIGMKYLTARPRPQANLLFGSFDTFSFPSSHVVMATVAYGIVSMLASQSLGRWSKAIITASIGLLVISIGFSRLYLGAHWTSDVLGGFLLGCVLLAGFAVMIEAMPRRRINPLGFAAYSTIVFLLAAGAHYGRDYDDQLLRYAAPEKIQTLALTEYRARRATEPPSHRIDMVGTDGEAFAAQWIGSAEDFKAVVETAGWLPRPKWSWKNGISYLDVGTQFANLEPRPLLHEGLKAKLTAIKSNVAQPNARIILRAYQTNVEVSESGRRQRVYQISFLRESLDARPKFYALPNFLVISPDETSHLLAELQVVPGVETLAVADAVKGSPPLLRRKP